MPSDIAPSPPSDRVLLRTRMRAARDLFVASPAFDAARQAMADNLVRLLHQLEPRCLGMYWSIRSEFNAVDACSADPALAALDWALPYCHRSPRAMDFRRWDRRPPTARDECNLLTGEGASVVPDLLLLPCVGFTDDGYRLGYGAGFFDRWQAANPQVTAVGVAWSVNRIAPGDYVAQQHDQPLLLVVTEHGVVGG